MLLYWQVCLFSRRYEVHSLTIRVTEARSKQRPLALTGIRIYGCDVAQADANALKTTPSLWFPVCTVEIERQGAASIGMPPSHSNDRAAKEDSHSDWTTPVFRTVIRGTSGGGSSSTSGSVYSIRVQFPLPVNAHHLKMRFDTDDAGAGVENAMHCPRCSRAVTNAHGVCSYCGACCVFEDVVTYEQNEHVCILPVSLSLHAMCVLTS